MLIQMSLYMIQTDSNLLASEFDFFFFFFFFFVIPGFLLAQSEAEKKKTFYMQHVLGVLIIRLKKIIKLHFTKTNLLNLKLNTT